MLHCGKSRAECGVRVQPCLASRFAGLGRFEGAIQDGPRPVRGWGQQDPNGQPEVHSRRLLSSLIVSVNNPATRTPDMTRSALTEITIGTPMPL